MARPPRLQAYGSHALHRVPQRHREMRADGCSFRWSCCPPLGCVEVHHFRSLSKLKPIALFSARDNEKSCLLGAKKFHRLEDHLLAPGVLLPLSVWSNKIKIADGFGRGGTELEYMQAIRHDASWLQLRGVR